GIIVQYGCRLVFTFNYEEKLNRYGAVFAGLGIAAITYFLLIKGLKGTSLINEETGLWVSKNSFLLLGVVFILGSIISRILQKTANINPLKVVVFMGTFSLAMAFAGNDLVNFIGVPITGFLAFQNWQTSNIPANEHYQEFLSGNDVVVPNYMLLIAGLIMALTLWLSAKAKKVTETEVNLGSQAEIAEERFQPNAVSRSIVKSSLMLGNFFSVILPGSLRRYYNLNFEKSKIRQATVVHDKPAFDLVRASVNLVLASSLIAMATSMKLPLSTTYVSFMVAMGTSLADKAWGRESAVYRVAGVLSVIGGWFITAFIAFGAAGLFVFILIKGGITGTLILMGLVAGYIIFSHLHFNRKEKKAHAAAVRLLLLPLSDKEIYEGNKKRVLENLSALIRIYNKILETIKNYDAPELEKSYKELKEMEADGFKLRAQSIRYIKNLESSDLKPAQILLYSTDLLQDITSSALTLGEECMHYIQNLHEQPGKEFIRMTGELKAKMNSFFSIAIEALQQNNFENIEDIKIARDDVREYINGQLDRYIKIVQEEKPGTRQAILESNILLQSRDMLAVTLRIIKMYRKYLEEK
ncbi:MAG TPA: hypothetical protein VI461_10700, partial [Chitinophagaceae bacterium]|nr:hypothetical protein [Chitinophagaceae bacterium]